MKSIRYELDIDDLIEYNMHMFFSTDYGARIKRLVRTLLFFVFLLGSALLYVIYYRTVSLTGIIVIIGIFFLAMLGVMYFVPHLLRWNIMSNVRAAFGKGENPGLTGEHNVEIREEGIRSLSEYGWNTFPWRIVRKIDETEGHIFIFVSEAQAVLIPKKKVEGDLAGFMKEVRDKMAG